MLALLAGELLHGGIHLISNFNPTLQGWWWPVIAHGRLLGEAILGAGLVTIFLSWPIFRTELRRGLLDESLATPNRWLAAHLLCLGLTIGLIAAGMSDRDFRGTTGLIWFLGSLSMLSATALTWGLALMAYGCWRRWLSASRPAVAAGVVAGILTYAAFFLVRTLWPLLTWYTFVFVGLMLRALGLPVISDPATALLGTEHFAVRIAPQCSGLEGIALICAFVGAYLWFYRAEYRFPAALLMLPFGVALIWLLNAVRISLLIVIGQWWSGLAVSGFHTVAGWIFFNLTAFGLVSASHHAGWLSRDDVRPPAAHTNAPNPAVPYLAPLLLIVAAAMLTVPFSHGFDAAYPIRVVIAGFTLWWYRNRIGTELLNFSWPAAAIGVACFGLWIVLSHPDHAADNVIAVHLKNLAPAMLGGWMLFRAAGAVIIVPLAEELAFRGYLQRKLIDADFLSVPFDRFTWPSFVISSTAFGLLHQNWIAGIGAGMLFAIAIYRRGRLADAITAHAVANALLGVYVIATGTWSLWM